MTVKSSEYSFFRAEGRSLEAVKAAATAREDAQKIGSELKRRYGAMDYAAFGTGTFVFRPGQALPENFTLGHVQKDSKGEDECVFAKVTPGTPDEFIVDTATRLIKELYAKTLEKALGSGEMPQKIYPAGTYEPAFVRDHTIQGEGKAGMLRDPLMFVFGSNGATSSVDRLVSLQILDDWFVRVPNDATGKPVYTPPDALAMTYDEMLELDRAQHALNRGQKADIPPRKPSPPRPATTVQDRQQLLRRIAKERFDGTTAVSGETVHVNEEAALLVPTPQRKEKSVPDIGDVMNDGTIYAGISPVTGEKMFTAPADAPDTMPYKEAFEYAAQVVDYQGRGGFRLPAPEELEVLYQNRQKGALKGSFNEAGARRHVEYWSTPEANAANGMPGYRNFSTGEKNILAPTHVLTARYIR